MMMKSNPPPYNPSAECASCVAPGGPSISGAGGQLRLRATAEVRPDEKHMAKPMMPIPAAPGVMRESEG